MTSALEATSKEVAEVPSFEISIANTIYVHFGLATMAKNLMDVSFYRLRWLSVLNMQHCRPGRLEHMRTRAGYYSGCP